MEVNNKDNDLLFSVTETAVYTEPAAEFWKIIIADDDASVHSSTRIVLSDLVFSGKGLKFLSAYSSSEMMELLKQNPDAAVILLDVVMETPSAGLDIVRSIRKDLNNKNVRIILRTGQPGEAPEKKVIIEYDINDYKEKNELSSQKLFTSVYSAIRSYNDLKTIEAGRSGLSYILNASADLFKQRSLSKLAEGSLDKVYQFSRLFRNSKSTENSFMAVSGSDNKFSLRSSRGKFSDFHDFNSLPPYIIKNLYHTASSGKSMVIENDFYGYIPTDINNHVLFIENYSPDTINEDILLDLFNEKIGIVFDNLYLDYDILNTQIELINVLGEIIENRSHETAFHVTRVSKITEHIMRKLSFSEDLILLYAHASPLHDIGKIGIPDSILLKPGKLTTDEFKIIKTHTSIGYKLLASSTKPLLKKSALIALQHHEKWDGTGYPDSIAKIEIDQVSRIVTIADIFDALSNDRVYKKAWKLDETLNYIRSEREKTFDPEIVDIFFDSLEDIIRITESYSN